MALSRVPGDEDLFVGGIFTLRRKTALENTGITHIVSVLKYDFKDFEDWEKYEHLSIEVDDVDDENLLADFERTGKFIEGALKSGGGVLVHCAMGKSRSVTVVIAYLLRQNPQHTVASALSLIRESRPIAEPNDGFMAQLELYKEMGCPRDIDGQPTYQRWLYQREVSLALAAGMAPDRVRFEDEEVQDAQGGGGKELELRCRKCRRTLATTPYLITHLPNATAPTQTSMLSHPTTRPNLPPPPTHTACTHHFLHPLSWMRPALEQGILNGRLECPNPKCEAQIGRYAWQGMRCSCGVWVCPAFSLQKGRIDEITKRGSSSNVRAPGKDALGAANVRALDEATAEGLGIRLPPGMRGKENL
ncbi:Dual specificity protein phosphatase 12 [Venustampulla echinocandica]|uniref:protein-tyrosine-phosphatase n=1 Tax=Venustampulla echinocandica TaxID=2656787 RepID=A0A370TQJ4_9HELO|nr:Dual specificity protein phosphatase 12 [Venustampulla echinocandica]RDL37793.1 Dual specificity protein phosphatase 12 [Venustampulla echinocandica]